jgi:hypothetical protein
MPEVVGAFLSTEQRNEGADRPEETRNSPRGNFAQQRFEFPVRQLDSLHSAPSSRTTLGLVGGELLAWTVDGGRY